MNLIEQYKNIKSSDQTRKEHYNLKAACEWIAFGWEYITLEAELIEDRHRDTEEYKKAFNKALAKLTIALRNKALDFSFYPPSLEKGMQHSKNIRLPFLEINQIDYARNQIIYNNMIFLAIDILFSDLQQAFAEVKTNLELNSPQLKKMEVKNLAKHFYNQDNVREERTLISLIKNRLKDKFKKGLSYEAIQRDIETIRPPLKLIKHPRGRPKINSAN